MLRTMSRGVLMAVLQVAVLCGACGSRTSIHVPLPARRDAGTDAAVLTDAGTPDAPPPIEEDAGCRPREVALPAWASAPSSVRLGLDLRWPASVSTPLGDRVEITLALVPHGGETLAVAHAPHLRFVAAATLHAEPTRFRCAEPGCALRVARPSTRCDGEADLVLRDLELWAEDLDCDGSADVLRGNADASAFIHDVTGMTSRWVEGAIELDAQPDTEPPSLLLESADLLAAPLSGVRLVPSEPLTTEAALDVLGTRAMPLRVVPDPRGFLVGAELRRDAPLTPREAIYVSADRDIRDFGGNAATAEARLAAWQGVAQRFPEDGFETGEGVLLQGGATLVEGIGRLPPMRGARSLWMPPGRLPDAPEPRWALMRLVPARTVSALVLEAQLAGDGAALDPRARYEVMVLDDEGRRGGGLITTTAPLEPTLEPAAPFASPAATLRFPLSTAASAGTSLLVVIRVETVTCGQPAPTAHGLLVDGVRLE